MLAPGCAAVQRLVKWTIARPFVLLWLLAMRPLARLCGRAAGNKLSAAAKKRRKKQLKNKARVLYNSDNPLVTPRGQCAHFSAKEAGSMEKKQKRAPLLPRFFLRAGLVLIGGYLVAGLVFNQVDIAAKQKELQDLENQLEQQRQQNDELERVLESGSDQEIIERVARDKLGYAKPNERVFIDVTGQ